MANWPTCPKCGNFSHLVAMDAEVYWEQEIPGQYHLYFCRPCKLLVVVKG